MPAITSDLFGQVLRIYGQPSVATLPEYGPDSDDSFEFELLARHIRRSKVVLFAPIQPDRLDGFFRLRLAQILARQGVHPALAVILLASGGAPPAGGFADRVRTAWPFARSVFVASDGDPQELSRLLSLPTGRLGDDIPKVRSEAGAGQKIALQLQFMWRGCGSTTAFENQVESLIQAGYLTIRFFADGQSRRSPDLTALLNAAIDENSRNAGAHIEALAVPTGPLAPGDSDDLETSWANSLASAAQARVTDTAIHRAAAQATAVIANHLDKVGLALALAPNARMILDTHDDLVIAEREWMCREGKSESDIRFAEAAAEWFQARIMRIPDVCTFVSETELARLGVLNPRSVLVLPRSYARPQPVGVMRYDVLLVGDEHIFNIQSVRWFLEEVWQPYLAASSISVAIAGRAGLRVQDKIVPSALLHFLGFVDDLEGLRSQCKMTAVPDQAGTGLPVKTLTSLTVGHPLVTTSMGLRGFGEAVARELPSLDSAREFAADVLALCSDPLRLEERRCAVQRAFRAIADIPNYATLLSTLPPLPPEEAERRRERWQRIAAPARRPPEAAMPVSRPDGQGCCVEFGVPILMSGDALKGTDFTDGWHVPEVWGRWTNGMDAYLNVVFGSPCFEPIAVSLDISLSPAGGTIALSVNGSRLHTFAQVSGSLAWDIPLELTYGKRTLVLGVHSSAAVSPASISDSKDDRVLGIGVRCVTLLRAPGPHYCPLVPNLSYVLRYAGFHMHWPC